MKSKRTTLIGAGCALTDGKGVGDDLQRAKLEAQARAEELSAILDAAPGMTLIARDPNCRSMTGGRVAYVLLRLPYGSNLSKSAPRGERPSNFRVYSNGRELSENELPVQRAAALGREVRDSELTIVFRNGDSRDFFGNAAPLLNNDGTVRGAVGVFVDITERKLAERFTREFGLPDAIRTYVHGFSERSGIKVDIQLPARHRRFDKDVETTLFRVVQEALTNVYRHSGSKRAIVRMRVNNNRLAFEIRDFGRGMKAAANRRKLKDARVVGIGIPGIRERLQHFGGELEVHSSTRGTLLRAVLPITHSRN